MKGASMMIGEKLQALLELEYNPEVDQDDVPEEK